MCVCGRAVGVPSRTPSAWLVFSAAGNASALLMLVVVFMFLWANVEAAQRAQPAVLLLGAERAAAAGRVAISVRLTALHALMQDEHSSPLLFQVVPATAAFNVLVGATSVGTFYELGAVATTFLSRKCPAAITLAAAASGLDALGGDHDDGDGALFASIGGDGAHGDLVDGDGGVLQRVLVPVVDTTIALVSKGMGWGE